MNISFELIIPPIILGILITMITGANVVMMDSTVENQSTYHLQTNANNTVLLISEEVRYLHRVETANGSSFEFVEKVTEASDSVDVKIFKDNEYLKVIRTPRGGSADTTAYFLRLDSLTFQETTHGTTSAPFLKVSVLTTSSNDEQINKNRSYKASAERSIYLKNLHASDIFYSTGS
ncbi:MAG: hypothetical protein JJ971_01255 [Balneolaceae bacterium]|nr:hypothetical protein [Balneolaceae bacterium]MBO6544998.1 hypothetical protein [Balneolaceae bacterium]MBO6646394.1 hypothetical protein [Balneolaceae bacterium]